MLVVGGSGGLGQVICRRFAESGSAVALTYNSNRERAEVAAAGVAAAGRKASIHGMRLENYAEVEAVIAEAELSHGSIHTVVYASGPNVTHEGYMPIAQVTPTEWERVVRADVIGYFNLIHAAIPALRRSAGSIVALTTAGLIRYPVGDILSAGPKAGVEHLTMGVAREEGRHGIRANTIGVGWIDAGQGATMKNIPRQAGFAEKFLKGTPIQRFGTAKDIADTALFLASASAGYVSGNLVCVDGGGHV